MNIIIIQKKEWTDKYANEESLRYIFGNITENNKDIEELIINYEKELDKVNEYYLKLIEVIEQNKKKQKK